MPADLTAILLPLPPRGLQPTEVINIVAQNAPPATWLRLVPFEQLEIHQLEVLDGGSGLPAVSPAMLQALAQSGNKAMFVHVNHQESRRCCTLSRMGPKWRASRASRTMRFLPSSSAWLATASTSWSLPTMARGLDSAQAASRTAALVRGRIMMVPAGTPTALGSFAFHDHGHDRRQLEITGTGDEDGDEAETTRVAFFAFDGNLISQAFTELPGKQLAQVLTSAPPEILGPLVAMRDHAVQALSQSDTPPGAAETHPSWHTHAFEIMALCHAGAYAGGDTLRFIDRSCWRS